MLTGNSLYVVMYVDYEDYDIKGIYDTREKAELRKALVEEEYPQKKYSSHSVEIYEYRLNYPYQYNNDLSQKP